MICETWKWEASLHTIVFIPLKTTVKLTQETAGLSIWLHQYSHLDADKRVHRHIHAICTRTSN